MLKTGSGISLNLIDLQDARKDGLVIYQERSYTKYTQALDHEGADVYIRMALTDADDSGSASECPIAPVEVIWKGTSACSKDKPCDIGEGDCDSDDECMTGLKCGQRDNYEILPGLTGFDK